MACVSGPELDAAPVESLATLMPDGTGSPHAIGVRTVPEPGVGASLVFALPLLALLGRRRARLARSRAGSP